MKKVLVALFVAAATAAIMVPLALAGGGNSDVAKACQQGGWQNLARLDGTGFNSQDECVSYGAHGSVPIAKPTSTPGSENFSSYAFDSRPDTFSGGKIDPNNYAPSPDGSFPRGAILIAGPYFNGFAPGTHFLFTGIGQNTAKLTFTNPVKSVQVQAESDKTGLETTLTLTGYDASNNVVATETNTHYSDGADSATLSIASASANIKYFTVTNDDHGNNAGLGITNIVWG